MGQTLSEPIKDKHSSAGSSARFVWGASAMQGWRISMEDAHTTLTDLAPPTSAGNDAPLFGFFAVFDGHGGSTVAKYAGDRLHTVIAEQNSYETQEFRFALKRGFLDLDHEMRNDERFTNDPAGCTAVAALVTDTAIFVANAGDSRAVLATGGNCKPLSDDHKPGNPGEQKRIEEAGGFVEFGRVNGNLALSRALGDFEFKQSGNDPEHFIVTACPDIEEHAIDTDNDEFLVLACDGIWDCISNDDCVRYVRHHLANGKSPVDICEDLMEQCVAPDAELGGVGCDNMTVVIVGLLGGRSEDEWANWIRDRYVADAATNPTSIAFARRNVPLIGLGINNPDGSPSVAASSNSTTAAAEDGEATEAVGQFN
ncbi:Protein phosphatase 2C 2 [Blastocladiella emersonii ATCC 22665]|nr:Protein phosphatase 2C 2 [Blastocladiella emersonii ATCC 22665]